MIHPERWIEHLNIIYKDNQVAKDMAIRMMAKFAKYDGQPRNAVQLNERDSILITYGDTLVKDGEKGFQTLHEFLKHFVKDAISTVHILPMFPYTSDDGFSVVNYLEINPELGSWEEVKKLAGDYGLMFDAVINHISRSSQWFKKYLACEPPYTDYFITSDPSADYRSVTRPRALPLLTCFSTKEGDKYVWTTFSEDQVDLNYRCPDVMIDMLDVLLLYATNGARFIRLDAIGFLWKELGTTCMHLPEAHEMIKLARTVLEDYVPGTMIISETNVPHKDNISYFGNGYDEAHLVYQFPLPPLVMFTLLKGNARHLTQWADTLDPPKPETAYFNFLSSHDGIGIRPTEGILNKEEQQYLVDATLRNGGVVSYKDNGDGTRSPYELNINYQDALASPEDSDEIRISRFLAAQTILLSMQGLPGIYIHSLLGSRNDYYGKTISGIPRRINREKLDVEKLEAALTGESNRRLIFNELLRRLKLRSLHPSFSPDAAQEIIKLDDHVFALSRISMNGEEKMTVVINVSGDTVIVEDDRLDGFDLLSNSSTTKTVVLLKYQCRWIICQEG